MTTHRSLVLPRYSPTAVEQPTLVQFLILSMLLHLLVIVLFGNTTGSRERRDEYGLWGSLDVTLRRLSSEPGPGVRFAPGAEQVSPGPALLPRSTGATDAATVPRRVESVPAVESPEVPATKRVEPVPESTEAAQPAQAAPPPAQPKPVETLPRLNLEAPEEVDKPYAPSAVSPTPIEREVAPPVVAPPVELSPREVPITPAPPAERIAPLKIEREVAPPVELTPREVPLTPPAPAERIAPPKIEREVPPPVEVPAPRPAPAETVAPAERVAPPVPAREATPALPRATPSEAAPRGERMAPPAPAPDKSLATPAPASPGISPAPPPARFHFGSPTPEDEVFRPRADVVSPLSEPEGQPYIDLEGARRQVRKVATEGSGSRGLVPFPLPVPPPPDRQSKEARALEKAIKPDCRAAYAGLGLLAIPMLAASALGDVGCRW